MTRDTQKWTRAPLVALRCALALGGAILASEAGATPRDAGATPRDDGGAEVGDRVGSLVLPRAAIAAALRRTAVADPDLDGVVTALEAAKYYKIRFELLDENEDRALQRPEFLRAEVVRSLYALDG